MVYRCSRVVNKGGGGDEEVVGGVEQRFLHTVSFEYTPVGERYGSIKISVVLIFLSLKEENDLFI